MKTRIKNQEPGVKTKKQEYTYVSVKKSSLCRFLDSWILSLGSQLGANLDSWFLTLDSHLDSWILSLGSDLDSWFLILDSQLDSNPGSCFLILDSKNI